MYCFFFTFHSRIFIRICRTRWRKRYLALMALFNFAPPVMKSSALLLNIFVSFIAFVQYYRGGYFKWKLFLPFAITSIPLAFIGASVTVDAVIYKRILGVILIFPIIRLFGLFSTEIEETKEVNIIIALVVGAFVGFIWYVRH